MTALAWLVPVALFLGGLGLAAFLWSLSRGQFDDLEGAGWRALDDEGTVIRASHTGSRSPVQPPQR
ncbi:MAG: cbb3-type cytochrome oxidase assembly protein CcoS [Hyphomicrobiaceae bacterium]|nr:cbb3-type cytochrome oxidase assembly protein CcoS [Hyphomicrobiaceae bacterium]